MERLLFLEPIYGFSAEQDHIAVAAKAERTEDVYQVGSKKGRVVGAVKLLPMPLGKTIHDYYFDDLFTQERRWPVGWPCKAVFAPPDGQAPVLRTLVEQHLAPGTSSPTLVGSSTAD